MVKCTIQCFAMFAHCMFLHFGFFAPCVSTLLGLALLEPALKVSACGISAPNLVDEKKERKKTNERAQKHTVPDRVEWKHKVW